MPTLAEAFVHFLRLPPDSIPPLFATLIAVATCFFAVGYLFANTLSEELHRRDKIRGRHGGYYFGGENNNNNNNNNANNGMNFPAEGGLHQGRITSSGLGRVHFIGKYYQGEDVKMVVAVRKDLRLPAGKIAEQMSHGCVSLFRRLAMQQTGMVGKWEECGQPKVCLAIESLEELNKLREKAKINGLPVFTVESNLFECTVDGDRSGGVKLNRDGKEGEEGKEKKSDDNSKKKKKKNAGEKKEDAKKEEDSDKTNENKDTEGERRGGRMIITRTVVAMMGPVSVVDRVAQGLTLFR